MDDYGGINEAQLLSDALRQIKTEQKHAFFIYLRNLAVHEEESNEPPDAIAA